MVSKQPLKILQHKFIVMLFENVFSTGISVNDEILNQSNPLFVVNHKTNAPQRYEDEASY